MFFHGLITKNYGWELGLFRFTKYSGGHVTFINLDMSATLKPSYDHTPSFFFNFTLLNTTILEISIYFIWHRDDNNNPIKPDGTPL